MSNKVQFWNINGSNTNPLSAPHSYRSAHAYIWTSDYTKCSIYSIIHKKNITFSYFFMSNHP